MSSSDAVRIGLIGLGYWGQNILRNLSDMGALAFACDTSPEIIAQRQGEFPNVRYTSCPEDIFEAHEVRAVAIATNAAMHYKLAKSALEAGKDVFVEKPLSLCVREGEELVQIARDRGRILMVGHLLQYHPAIITLHKLVREGVLGDLQYVYSNRLNIGRLRTEENVLWSFAPHDVSVILSLVGAEPLDIEARGGAYVNPRIHDVTLTSMTFDGGIRGHVFVSWLHPYKEQRLVVVGSEGMAVFDDCAQEKLCVYPHTIEIRDGVVPIAHKAERRVIHCEDKEPLSEELQHFIACVRKRKNPRTDGSEGVRVLRVLERAEKSLQTSSGHPTGLREEKKYFVHPSSYVDERVTIGRGTKIWYFCHILSGCIIGDECIIGQNVMIGPDVTVGSKCKIQNNVSLYKGVTLEDEVFCGPSCVFTNVVTPRAFVERKDEFAPTLVRRGATIGANATVVCGVTVGRYALVGAGAVVTRDVPDYALVVGVPARQVGWVCKCGVPLVFDLDRSESRCKRCAGIYAVQQGKAVAIEEQV